MKRVLGIPKAIVGGIVRLIKGIFSLPGKAGKFLKEVYLELKLVEFPARGTTFRTTNIVLAVSLALGTALLLVDALFTFIRTYLTSLK